MKLIKVILRYKINYHLKFLDLVKLTDFPRTVPELKSLVGSLMMENADLMNLFAQLNNTNKNCLKFTKDVYASVTLLVQAACEDLLRLAIKNCKKLSKKTISVENLSNIAYTTPID